MCCGCHCGARVCSRISPRGIWGQSGIEGFSSTFSVFLHQYYSTATLRAHTSPGGWTVDPLVAAVQRHNPTPSTEDSWWSRITFYAETELLNLVVLYISMCTYKEEHKLTYSGLAGCLSACVKSVASQRISIEPLYVKPGSKTWLAAAAHGWVTTEIVYRLKYRRALSHLNMFN
jgi:hypothetical protein